MSFVTYAQNFEDVLLLRALGHVERGCYIDIGAQDPVVDSVSLAFYEANWRGIHVEPTPFYAERLRNARPDEKVIQAVVADKTAPLTLYEIPDTGLSTGKVEISKHHEGAGSVVRPIEVPTVQLEDLLSLPKGEIHWLKIDVEGMEAEVLRSWGDSSVRPWVLVVESTYPNSQIPTEHLWIDEVLKRDYHEVFFDGLSRYFVHEKHIDLQKSFAAPANVFDQFLLSQDHFAARALRDAIQAAEARALAAESLRSAAEQQGAEQLLQFEQDREQRLNERRWHEETMYREHKEREETLRCALEERQRATIEALHTEHRDREKLIADALTRAQEKDADLRVRLALLEQHEVRATAEIDSARRQLDAAQRELSDVRTAAELRRDEMERQAAEMRSQLELALAEATHSIAHSREQHASLAAGFAEELGALRAEAVRQSAEQQAAFSHVHSLIEAILDEKAGRWQRLGELLGIQRPSVARQVLANWLAHGAQPQPSSPNSSSEQQIASPTLLSSTRDESRDPYLRAESLRDLLSWHDMDFVRCAYVTILGRQPDPDGEKMYTARVRDGMSKLQILWELRTSEEGKGHDPGLAGFDRTLRRFRRARLPVIGPIVGRPFVQEWTQAERRARRLENEFARANEIHNQRLIRIEHRLNDVSQNLERIAAHGVGRRVEHHQSEQVAFVTDATAPGDAQSHRAIDQLVSRFSASALSDVRSKLRKS